MSIRLSPLIAGLLLLTGCANFGQLADSLGDSMASQPDPQLVRDGGPAWIILADGLAADRPNNADLRLAAGRLYASYASSMVDNPERVRILTTQGLDHAHAGLCRVLPDLCAHHGDDLHAWSAELDRVAGSHAERLYIFGVVHAAWLQARSEDYAALAELPHLEATFARVLELAPDIDQGNAHVYYGVLLAQRPASLGGQPDRAREHFEQAIEMSAGRNLMAQVMYAEHYARLVFDRELHDRLLDEVLAADPQAGTLTLANALAQERAHELQANADDYF